MVSAFTATLDSSGTSTDGSLLRTMLGWILGTSKLKEAHRNLFLELAARMSAPLLRTEGIDDLEAELDEILESEDFAEWLRLVPSLLRKQTVVELAEAGVTEAPAELVDVFGCESLLNEAFRLASITAQAFLHSPSLQAEKAEIGEDSPLAFLHDPRVPTEVAHVLLASLRGQVCALVIAHVDATRNRPAPWLARALAERWVHGLREYLRLLAAIPSTMVSDEDMPQRERIDLTSANRWAVLSDIAFDELIHRARKFGESVYPPLNADDQD